MKIFLGEVQGWRTGTGLVTWRFCTGRGGYYNGNFYYPLIIQPAKLRRDASILGGRAQASYGECLLIDANGAINGMADDFFDGRTFVLLRGDEGAAYATFSTVLSAVIDQVVVEMAQVSVRLRDRSSLLEYSFSPARYSGTNVLPAGVEGTADDIKGQSKPRVLGRVALMQPVLCNTSKLIYQVSDKACDSVTQAFVAGSYLARKSDNLCRGVPVYASSEYSASYVASYAVDGNTGTRWASVVEASSWFAIDFGVQRTIRRIRIRWEAAYASSYTIKVGNDGSTWPYTIYSTSSGAGGVEEFAIPSPVSGRWIAIFMTPSVSLCSFWEVECYATSTIDNADYVSQADMEANQPNQGAYRVWSSDSGTYIRLGSAAAFGIVSCSVVEKWTHTQISAAGLVSRILTEIGWTSADWVAADFTNLDQKCCGPLGVVVQDGETISALLDRILGTVGAWWGFDSLNRIRFGRLDDPATGISVATITDAEMNALERQEGQKPVWQITMPADRSYAVQSKSELAGIAAADSGRSLWLETETRDQAATDSSVKTSRPTAEDSKADGFFSSISQARSEAERRLALLKVRRDVVTVTLQDPSRYSAIDIGSVVTVQTDRLGYTAGRKMVVTGIGVDYQGNFVDLSLWG